jgi:carbamoyltransferase
MNILGAWSGHDCSYCVLDNGKPVVHNEYERFIREKEPAGDALAFFLEESSDIQNISHIASCYPSSKLTQNSESLKEVCDINNIKDENIHYIGHHQAHAANAFFSSNFDESLIITVDGGGVEENNVHTALTVWGGKGNKIQHLHTFPLNHVNIGGVWTRATRYIFKLQSGWPRGHQAGSVMAMAAMGDPKRFHNDFAKMLTVDLLPSSHKPSNQPRGALIPGKDPVHPYLNKWLKIAEESEQNRFDLAAGLQSASEELFRELLRILSNSFQFENLCLAGGVSLNSVMVGKITEWQKNIKNVYVTPCPHDGGLPIGAAQYLWHHILDNPRIEWKDNFTPYLGKTYSVETIKESLDKNSEHVSYKTVLDSDVIDLLSSESIVSVFGGGSESGRRALGNRSILADPRSSSMKDMINEKVKHRQWYRPFAPSILSESVSEWFDNPQDSPYMSTVLKFKEDKREKVPAVVHIDGTARLQSVTKLNNPWYHNFLTLWNKKSGVPILLNTSFNDREPICETPDHAIRCFLNTEIDYLYFYDYGILVQKG